MIKIKLAPSGEVVAREIRKAWESINPSDNKISLITWRGYKTLHLINQDQTVAVFKKYDTGLVILYAQYRFVSGKNMIEALEQFIRKRNDSETAYDYIMLRQFYDELMRMTDD